MKQDEKDILARVKKYTEEYNGIQSKMQGTK